MKSKKTYTLTRRNKWLTAEAKSLDDMIKYLSGAVAELEAMKDAGVQLDDNGGVADDYATLFTHDPQVAARFDMPEEEEWDEGEEEP